jgi:hypothetical protein
MVPTPHEFENFLHWIRSPEGRATLLVINVLTLVVSLPLTATLDAIVLGSIVGMVFVAATCVLTGGAATLDDYVNAFLLGFAVGSAIADISAAVGTEVATEGSIAGKTSLGRELLGRDPSKAAEDALRWTRQVPDGLPGRPIYNVMRPPIRSESYLIEQLSREQLDLGASGAGLRLSGGRTLYLVEGRPMIAESITEATLDSLESLVIRASRSGDERALFRVAADQEEVARLLEGYNMVLTREGEPIGWLVWTYE